MVTVISQITLRVGGKKIPAGTPVAISEADAENLSEYITIVSEASVSDDEAPNEEAPNDEAPNEDIPSEEEASENDPVNTAPRGRGRPPLSQK
ncbi:MAG TPA: hypothetical protein PLI74_13880 [Candidatus Kapabacteria bacterium]|nr:hypothetical protein [Candidatus Kapabacteria bacterium]